VQPTSVARTHLRSSPAAAFQTTGAVRLGCPNLGSSDRCVDAFGSSASASLRILSSASYSSASSEISVIAAGPSYSDPEPVAYDTANGLVYVGLTDLQTVAMINGSSDKIIGSSQTGISPVAIAFDSTDGQVFVANQVSGNVTVLNGSTGRLVTSIPVGELPSGVAFDGSNGFLYVSNLESKNVTVINATADRTVGSIPVNSPLGIAYDPQNGFVYVSNWYSNNVSVINGSADKVIASISTGAYPVAVTVAGLTGRVYVANSGSSNVTVINATTDDVVGSISVGDDPSGIGFESGDGLLYVANAGSSNASVINGTTDQVVGSVALGSQPVGATYDDSNHCVYIANSHSGSVSVIGQPLSASLTILPPVTDVGAPVGLVANGSGGLPPVNYSYSWTFGDLGYAYETGNATSHIYAAPGPYTVNLTIVDSHNSSARAKGTVEVNAPPASATPLASSAAADVGQTVRFTTAASLGTPPYVAFAWSGLPAGCSGTTASVTCSNLSVAGSFSISVTATDSVGGVSVSSGSLPFTVYGDPLVATPAANRSSADVGQRVQFATSEDNGSGGFVYNWTGLPSGCAPASTSRWENCTFGGAGSSNVTVTVTDSDGSQGVSGTLLFHVYADPVVAVSASQTTIDVGGSLDLNATASLGSGAYAYRWSFPPLLSCTVVGGDADCVGIKKGSASATVYAEDSNQFQCPPATFDIMVNLGLSAAIISAPTTLTLGQSAAFSATSTGGTAPITFAWTFGDGGKDLGALVSHPYGALGSFKVTLWVNDSAGGSVEKSIQVTVGASPSSPQTGWAQAAAISVGAAAAASAVIYFARKRQKSRR
jgi:YVTN family beta-propeller protein